ncbi:hypothetical protein [Vibrio bivalvicida]|uniref:Uncharacterized protein n=1 Tax=Vibrio bivalvicida TaxID=1276888 RepID=A0ABV4ML71_9VIBR
MSTCQRSPITLEMIESALQKVEATNRIDLSPFKEFIANNNAIALTSFAAMSQCDNLDEKFQQINNAFPQFISNAQQFIEASILLS